MANQRIDFTTAWRLLRQLADTSQPGPLMIDGEPEPRLSTEPDGRWTLFDEPADESVADLLNCFMPLCHPAREHLVFAQVGQSLDGRIATVTGASHYINGDDGLDHLHRLRAIADIVIVGAGTACSDHPRLTVRRVEGRNPDRAVIDPRRRVSNEEAVFDAAAGPSFRLVADAPHTEDELQIAEPDRSITPHSLINCLQSRGYRRIFIEGGSQTVSSFLQAGCLDHLHLIVAPMIIGSGIPALQLPEIDELDLALRPQTVTFPLGTDHLFDMRFNRST